MLPPDDQSPTVRLLEQWRTHGDEAAFHALERRLAPGLRGQIQRHSLWPQLRQKVELDDLTQRIWIRALPALLERFSGQERNSLLIYLGPFVRREVLDIARRFRAERRGSPERLDTEVLGGSPPPGRSIDGSPTGAARISELLEMAKSVLSEIEFEVWELTAIEGYTAVEVASDLGRTDAAVRGIAHRARNKILERIEAQSDL